MTISQKSKLRLIYCSESFWDLLNEHNEIVLEIHKNQMGAGVQEKFFVCFRFSSNVLWKAYISGFRDRLTAIWRCVNPHPFVQQTHSICVSICSAFVYPCICFICSVFVLYLFLFLNLILVASLNSHLALCESTPVRPPKTTAAKSPGIFSTKKKRKRNTTQMEWVYFISVKYFQYCQWFPL